ncbi:MAG: hypothetical protein IPH45_15205, partial [Bacteroidales bacterium]|nr:hypothetical protein [Bacteroidales bacterium]
TKRFGYEPVARWFNLQRPFVDRWDIRSPQVDLENAQLFMTTNAAQSITGQWTSVGPDMPVIDADNLQGPVAGIGRVSGIAFHPTDQNIVYVGAPLGGLWISYNQGLQWENLNTDNIASLGVSAIAINPENTDEIIIGTKSKVIRGTKPVESDFINPSMQA